MAFAKLKALLRKAAARTRDTLWNEIGDTLSAFTPQERANYFKHAGYAPHSIRTNLVFGSDTSTGVSGVLSDGHEIKGRFVETVDHEQPIKFIVDKAADRDCAETQ
jgi:hypothetical protein